MLIAIVYAITSPVGITSGSEGFINIPRLPDEVMMPPTNVKDSEGPSLPSAPFYGISEDRPCPRIDPANEVTTLLRIRRLHERLESFFLYDHQFVKDKVDLLEPYTNAKALLVRLAEEVHFLDANPGMPPTIMEKKILEGEATLGFLERQSRLVTMNEIDAYSRFQGTQGVVSSIKKKLEGFVSGSSKNKLKTRASVQDIVNFNIRAWAEIQRLGSSGTNDPVTTARISAIQNIRQSMQRTLDDIQTKKLRPEDIPVYKEDIEGAFPAIGDPTQPIPKIIENSSLPPELVNLLPPGASETDKLDTDKLVAHYINHILSSTSFSMQFGLDYTAPNKVRIAEAAAMKAYAETGVLSSQLRDKFSDKETIAFAREDTKPKLNVTFTNTDGSQVESLVVGPANSAGAGAGAGKNNYKTADSTLAKFTPSLDWNARTRQICQQVRARGLDPKDFGCLGEGDEVSPSYSWRGHAKMVCSRLGSTPDPALPETCGCPPAAWGGWNSDYSDGDYP